MIDSLHRLYEAVLARRRQDPAKSKTAKLFAAGRGKMAQKVGEEAVEVALEAVQGRTQAVISESADLLYNLTVLWADMGIRLDDIWAEIHRRETLYGIAEKLPKSEG